VCPGLRPAVPFVRCAYSIDSGAAAVENRRDDGDGRHSEADICLLRGAPVRGGLVPVLWLCGPAGVGKSTVSWQLFTELARSGVHVAFADTDQLCMCYPAPQGDPGRQRIKALNVDAMIANYRAAGARCVIVNGVIDLVEGVQRDLLPHAALTLCRLRADRDEVVRRFIGRHGQSDDLEELLEEVCDEADGMDASKVADVCVDTTGVPEAEVADLVRDNCRGWPGFAKAMQVPLAPSAGPDGAAADSTTARRAASSAASGADGQILLICGPTGVGKSTIGFELYMTCLRAGLTAGYIDLDQIGFLSPAPGGDPRRHRLKASNLAAMWQTYHAAGARHVIATGPIDDEAAFQAYAEALPAATVTICRLRAGRTELTRRVMSRGEGGSWPQPGDPLRGQPIRYLRQVADQALADADALEREHVGMPIDTDDHTPAQAAGLIAAATGWRLPGWQEPTARSAS
jgi:adenylylsulfate kinase-like enzyme